MAKMNDFDKYLERSIRKEHNYLRRNTNKMMLVGVIVIAIGFILSVPPVSFCGGMLLGGGFGLRIGHARWPK